MVVVGEKVIIWGGSGKSDGAIYDLRKGSWHDLKDSPIVGRDKHIAVVIGKKLIIWGGYGDVRTYNDGAIYELPVIWE